MKLSEQQPARKPSYRRIKLTQGKFTTVDSDKFDWLNQWKWFASWNKYTKSFYATRRTGPRPRICVYMHRFILGLDHGDKREGDHKKSGSTLDNRIQNLRIATHAQNMQNRRKYRTSTSRFRGVRSNGTITHPYRAQIGVNGKQIFLGNFATAKQAAKAYDVAARKYHGEFAHLNFPSTT